MLSIMQIEAFKDKFTSFKAVKRAIKNILIGNECKHPVVIIWWVLPIQSLLNA